MTESVGSPKNTYDAYVRLYDMAANRRMSCLMNGHDLAAAYYAKAMRYIRIRYAREHNARLV